MIARSGILAKQLTRLRESSSYRWLAFGTVVISMTFIAHVDQGMLNVALPTITRDLKTDLPSIQWVVTAYLLVITSSLLVFGRLGDLFGRERVFVAGFGLFTVAAGLSGMAQSVEQLIFLRVVTGIGSAMMTGNNQAIVASVFPARELGKAQGIYATIGAAGTMLGPAVGGFVVDAFDWRTAFYLRVPIGIIGLVVGLLVFKPGLQKSVRSRFDYSGALAIALGTVALLTAINQGGTRGWDSPLIVGLLIAFLTCLLIFIVLETRVEEPLVDLSIFRTRLFTVATICHFISFFAIFAVSVLVPFYLVQVAGYQASQAGLVISVQALAMFVASPVSGLLSDRMGSRLLSTAGLASSGLGLFLLSRLSVQPSLAHVLIALGLVGLGAGAFQPPNVRAMMGSIPADKLGLASSFVPLMRNLGSVLGVGVLSAVFASRIVAYGGQMSSRQVVGQLVSREVMVVAFDDAFIVAAAACFVGIAISLTRGSEKSHLPPQKPDDRDRG